MSSERAQESQPQQIHSEKSSGASGHWVSPRAINNDRSDTPGDGIVMGNDPFAAKVSAFED